MEIRDLYGRRDLRGAYLFFGSEAYLREDALAQVKTNHLDPGLEDFNCQVHKGEATSLEDLETSLETLPLMGEVRLVILQGAQEFVDKAKPEEDFYKGLEDLAPTTLFIMVEDQAPVKKNLKLYKRMKKAGRAISFEPLKPQNFTSFVAKYLARKGRRIRPADLAYLVERTGYNSRNITVPLNTVAGDLDKLVALSKDEISRDMVDMVLEPPADESIFNLLAALAKREPGPAYKMAQDLVLMGEPIPRIIYMIIRQVRLLTGFKILQERGLSLEMIQARLKIKPYEAKKIAGQSRAFSKDLLFSYYPLLIDAELKVKTTSADEMMVLEVLLAKMTDTGGK